MTNNQKAATFIGWTPCDRDPNDVLTCMVAHAPAPDMSKPENYVRALETRILNVLVAEVILDSHDRRYGVQSKATAHYPVAHHGAGSTLGEAIINYLANVYDAYYLL